MPENYTRETLILPDGGTIGIDWDGGIPDKSAAEVQPIILQCPGLGGGSENLYNIALGWKAKKEGYKCGTILFRGASGVPITTPKLSHSGCWKDAQFAYEHVHKNYVLDSKTGKKRTRLYGFGVSLGSNILALYVGMAGKKATEILDGVALFSTPWSTFKGHKFFYNNNFGIWQKIIGLFLNATIKKH